MARKPSSSAPDAKAEEPTQVDPFASIRRPKAQARLQTKIMIYPSEDEAAEIREVAQRNDVSMSGLLMLTYREWRARNRDKV